MLEKREQGQSERRLEETKRLGRVLRMASLLTNQPGLWNRADLAAHFEVSTRMIDRDLEMLRGLGYEITRPAIGGYAFARTPALPPVTLSLAQVLALTLAAGLARDSGDIDTISLGAALAQLEALMPRSARPLIRKELLRREVNAQAAVARRPALETIQRAWLERRRVRIAYTTASRDGAITERVVEPYAIHPYERSWMVTALDHHREEIRIFKIDRILSATLLDERYNIPATFDLAQYRGTAWGILRGEAGEPVDVTLLFSAQAGRWVQEEDRGVPVTIEQCPDGSIRVRMHVGITNEMVRWILGFGPGCLVELPAELGNRVREVAESTAQQYKSSVTTH